MKQTMAILISLIFILTLALPLFAFLAYPDLISLPNGWRPEGITVGNGPVAYAGSLATGAIYRVNLVTGEGEITVPHQQDRIAVGLAYDRRSDYIFAAGGPAGAGYVYSATTGESVGSYQFTTEGSFVNDGVVTNEAVYFTDSFRPFLYKVPLGPNGRLPDADAFETIPLGGDFVFVPGAFNSNGIEATSNGESLIIVHSSRAELYHVDPNTGRATLVDLGGGSVPNGDGLLLEGNTLYVMQNRLNQIGVIVLDPQLVTGEIVRAITDSDFDVPTTIARFGNAIYAVNARFGIPDPNTGPYDIVRVQIN